MVSQNWPFSQGLTVYKYLLSNMKRDFNHTVFNYKSRPYVQFMIWNNNITKQFAFTRPKCSFHVEPTFNYRHDGMYEPYGQCWSFASQKKCSHFLHHGTLLFVQLVPQLYDLLRRVLSHPLLLGISRHWMVAAAMGHLNKVKTLF